MREFDGDQEEFEQVGKVPFYQNPPFGSLVEEVLAMPLETPSQNGEIQAARDLPYLITRAAEIRQEGKNNLSMTRLRLYPHELLPGPVKKAFYKGTLNQSIIDTRVKALLQRLDGEVPEWGRYVCEQLVPLIGDAQEHGKRYTRYGIPYSRVDASELPLTYRAWRIQQDRAKPPPVQPQQL